METESFGERVRNRIGEEMRAKKLSHRDVAGILEWNPNKVHKLLNGRVRMTTDDLWWLCFAIGLPVSEVVRDRGLEFYAEMTPTELRVLHILKAATPEYREAIYKVLNVKAAPTSDRYATKPQTGPKFGKARPR